MESFRLSSKLFENDREYLIQTTNDADQGSVSTTIFVDGVRADTFQYPHPNEMAQDRVLALVKATHQERKKEMETLLQAFRQVSQEGDGEAMFRLATTLYYRRLYHEAADLLRGLTRLSPGNHQAHHLLSMTLMALGDSVGAITAAAEAVGLRPGYADYRNNLGETLLASGAASEAVAEFEAAISINMYYGDAYFNLGLARIQAAAQTADPELRRQIIDRVIEHLRKTVLIQPALENDAQYQEGLAALSGADYAGALAALRRVREALREARRQEFVAANRRLLMHDDFWTVEAIEEQIRTLRLQLDQNPTYLDLQIELARCYLEQAGLIWQRGIDECRRIVEAYPDAAQVEKVAEQARTVSQAMVHTISVFEKKD